MSDRLLTNCALATMAVAKTPYGLTENAAIAIQNGRIAWTGDARAIPASFSDINPEDLGGRLVTPAFIDCHTHLVFGGDRAHEFEMRLRGADYETIAKAGGGILSTVRATRGASDQDLLAQSLVRLDALLADGVAVVEVKSGYGLTIDQELRMLRIAKQLEAARPAKIIKTWLAAHTIPPEYAGNADGYIDDVAIAGLEMAAEQGLVDAVDAYCEHIAFSRQQVERLFAKAQELGIPRRLHAEQLSDQKGALTAARAGALSADHLEYVAPEDVPAFAKADMTAVLLPSAYYTLRETQLPPVAAFRDHGVPMAVATDCNPGTSPNASLLLAMNMACTMFRLTYEEALLGVTRNAAKALGLSNAFGTVEPGKRAEIAIWNADHPRELGYWLGASPLHERISFLESAS